MVVLLSVLLAGSPASADVKARLPQQSVLYIEFAGADACGDACAATPLGKLLDGPRAKRLTGALWQALDGLVMTRAGSAGSRAEVAAAKELLTTIWHKGLAIDLVEVGFTETGPAVALIVASEIGDQADRFVAQLEEALRSAPVPIPMPEEIGGKVFQSVIFPVPFPMPVRYGVVDGVFLLMVGPETPSKVLAVMAGEAPNLGANASLGAALRRIGTRNRTTGALLHLDVAEAVAQARRFYRTMLGQEDFPLLVTNLLEELGFNGLKSATCCTQIAEGGYRTSFYLDTEGTRKGVLKLLEQSPVTDDDLLWIPRDASFASAVNFRLVGMYDEAMRVLSAVPGLPKEMIEAQLAQLEQKIGLKVRDEILAVLDDGLIIFDAPSNGGFLFTGTTLVVEVTDEAAANKLIRRAADAVLSRIKDDVSAEVLSADHGAYEISFVQFVGVPVPLAPAWCVHKKHLVVALTPQTVKTVMDRVLSADPKSSSILANADFQRGRKLLPESLMSVGFVDTKAGVSELYRMLLLGGVLGTNYAQQYGVAVDAAMIPDLAEVTGNLYGDVWGTTVDEEGVLETTHGPLPFPVPRMSSGGGMTTPLLVSIVLPSLSRARQLSKRMVSLANLKGIGTACMVYAYEHQEQYPPDLQTLVDRGDVTEKQLVAPAAPDSGRSYTYIPGHTSKSEPGWVVAYEDWPNQTEEGAAVLFADGHAEFIKPLSRVNELVRKTRAEMVLKQQQQQKNQQQEK